MTQEKTTGFYIPPEELIPMVERFQRGETTIDDEIYGVFYNKVFGHVRKMVFEYPVAKELTNDIFLEITRKKHTLRNPAAFVGWVNRIVISKCNSYHREKDRALRRQEKELRKRKDPAYKKRKWTDSEKEMLIAKIEQLPPKQAAVMQLHYIDEKTVEEISAFMEVPVGTVKSRLHYGRLSFQKLILQGSSIHND